MRRNLNFETANQARHKMISKMFEEIHDSGVIGGKAADFAQSLYEFFKANHFLTARQFTSLELMYFDAFPDKDS